MSNNIIPIFYACDDNFAKYTLVSLKSVIDRASDDCIYNVHILHTNISQDMQDMILRLKKDNVSIEFNNVEGYLSSIEDKLPLRDYYTKTTYFRVFIAEMFPEYEKAIYIDSDTIVKTDLSYLYHTEIGDCYVGACHEQAMVQVDVYGTYAESVVGVSRHNFFNAGLLIINCKMWREKKILERFLFHLGEYNFSVTQDEDYLNLICKDRVFWLDQRWNTAVTEGFTYPYKPSEAYVIHYIMCNKPWHYENCTAGEEFWTVAEKTELYETLKQELADYSDDQRENDSLGAKRLYELAIAETNKEDNYQKILNKTKRSQNRVEITKRIEQYEREGKFDLDVEDDPPTRVLMPDEIDYMRSSLSDKLKTAKAHYMAKKFLNKIQKDRLMIIKEVKGLENMRAIEGGAVITCNHFNPFDTFAMHEAFLRSGVKKKKLYRVIREGNYTSFPGFYGYLMRNFYTLPLSSNRKTMHKFSEATDRLLKDGNFVLIYPEQSMWWNYRKPKPLKSGAYSIAVRSNVPVLPCFITMTDSDKIGEDGYPIQEYTINIGEPIYPDESLSHKDKIESLMAENARVWKNIYESFYNMPLEYTTIKIPR